MIIGEPGLVGARERLHGVKLALERAGMLFGCETFDGRNWYQEGAKLLLAKQHADGSWGDRKNKDEYTWDTCFAILFLKKATRAVATEAAGSRK